MMIRMTKCECSQWGHLCILAIYEGCPHVRSRNMSFQPATRSDISLLAELNRQLIRDEGHRNSMSLAQLEDRMVGWLDGEYQAILFEHDGTVVGYALYKEESEWLYLRQFFVVPDFRRRGIGRCALNWLMSHVWKNAERIRLDVLAGNTEAIAFWREMGFESYCLTMEQERSRDS